MSAAAVAVKKLKVALGADIRRFPLPVPPTMEALRGAVAAAFKLDAAALTLAYRDDEGDVVTLGSTAELLEALAVAGAAGHAALKLLVNAPRGEAGFVSVESVASAAAPAPVADAAPLASPPLPPQPQQQEAPAALKPEETKPEAKPEETKSEAKPEPATVPARAELVQLVAALLGDADVQAALPTALAAGLASLQDGETVETAVDTVLASADAIADHASVRRLRPLLPRVLPRLEPLAAVLREHDLSFVPALAAQLLPQAAAVLQMLAAAGGDGADLPFSPGTLLAQVHPLFSRVFEAAAEQACCGGEGGESFFGACFTETPAAGDAQGKAPQQQPQPQQQQGPAHRHFRCDGCNASPITGDRYHCTVCADYDLCSACEARNVHAATHPLLKIRLPLESPEYQAAQVHVGVACDGCGQQPLTGVRFKCAACPNYDLCAACEAKGVHPVTHPLVKHRTPVHAHGVAPGAFGVPPPWARGHRGGGGGGGHHHGHRFGPRHHGFGGPRVGGFGGGLGGLFRHVFGRGGCPARQEGACGQQQQQQQQQADAAANKADAAAAAAGAPAGAGRCPWRARCQQQQQQQPPREDKPRASFVRDVNLPDGAEVPAGAGVRKVWALTNSGAAAWPEGAKLIFLRGDRELSAAEEFAVPRAAPGETVEVAAELAVPAAPGRYRAYYTLATAERAPFGQRFWVDVVVAVPAHLQQQQPQPQPQQQAEQQQQQQQQQQVVAAVTQTEPEEKKASAPPAEAAAAAAAPAPVAAAPAAEEAVDASDPRLVKFAMQVQILASMGFRDRALVLRVLAKHDGDITKSYNELVNAVLGAQL